MQGAEIVQCLFLTALNEYFHSNPAEMAYHIGCTKTEVERALSNDGVRIRAKIFECLMAYCAKQNLSVDALIQPFYHQD